MKLGRIISTTIPNKSLLLFQTIKQNAKHIHQTKVKGGALYIAIIISIIIGIILCMFIMLANYNQRSITNFTQSTQLYYNLNSAFEIAQSDYLTEERNNKWIKNISNDDSIKINKKSWGAYLLINAQTKNRHQSMSQCGLYGTFMPSDTGLIISENDRSIGLSGNINFKANCYLSKAGIKAAYIEGQSYINASQNSGFTKISNSSIPQIDRYIIDELTKQQDGSTVFSDSIVSNLPNSYNQSFNSKTVTWESVPNKLSNVSFKNNIKLITENIEVDNTSQLENILIVCSKIKFKEGFKGKVHVIASDSIIIEKKCEFLYPSSFVLLPKEENSTALKCIMFSEECKFFGGMLALTKNNDAASSKVFIKLNGKSEINGLVYSSNYLHLEGKVNATIIADKLLLKTPSAVYENHMLSCEINPKKNSSVLAIPLTFKKSSKLLCCQKMN